LRVIRREGDRCAAGVVNVAPDEHQGTGANGGRGRVSAIIDVQGRAINRGTAGITAITRQRKIAPAGQVQTKAAGAIADIAAHGQGTPSQHDRAIPS